MSSETNLGGVGFASTRRMGTDRNALYKMMHDARLRLKGRLEREDFRVEGLLDRFGN